MSNMPKTESHKTLAGRGLSVVEGPAEFPEAAELTDGRCIPSFQWERHHAVVPCPVNYFMNYGHLTLMPCWLTTPPLWGGVCVT